MNFSTSRLIVLYTTFFIICFTAVPGIVRADTAPTTPRQYLRKIKFKGLRIWKDQDLRKVVNRVGLRAGETLPQPVFEHRVNMAVKKLQSEGLFSDIQVTRQGDKLVFKFFEYPRINNIKFNGNSELTDKQLNDVILLQRNDPASSYNINRARRELSTFYLMRGYEYASVETRVEKGPSGRAIVSFLINEGKQKVITGVYFDFGEIDLMTRIHRKWGIGWKTPLREGVPYSGQSIQSGIAAIRQWYYSRGYMDVNIDAEAFHNKVEGGYDILYHIKEGPIYQFGKVKIKGNSVYGDTLLKNKIPLSSGAIYNHNKFHRGLQAIEDHYQAHGYVEASVMAPGRYRIKRDRKRNVIDVSINIKEGQPYYVERIEVHGNQKTYDRVIRREFRLHKGDLLEGVKLRNSKRRLRNLGFFKNVKINVAPGSKQNTKIIRVKVEEGRTGRLQFGGGYSSSSGLTGQLSIKKDNFSLYDYSRGFTGRGQSLETSLSFGQKKDNYRISWDDPWFNDDIDEINTKPPKTPISFGWTAFSQVFKREEDYDEIKQGGSLRFGREFGPALSNKVDVEYSFRKVEVDDLSEAGGNAPEDYLSEARRNSGDTDGFSREIGSFEIGLQRDRRDNRLFPTEGYYLRGSSEVAAEIFGGNTNFYRPEFDFRGYLPFLGPSFWAFRFNYQTLASWKDESDTPIPSFEKFYLGGHRSVRGYDYRDIALYNKSGDELGGGKSAFFTNLELRMMLIENTMQIFLFGDLGNVYRKSWEISTSDAYSSTGFGFRIHSPIGPIILSWGKKLENTYPGADDKGEVRVEFTIGSGF